MSEINVNINIEASDLVQALNAITSALTGSIGRTQQNEATEASKRARTSKSTKVEPEPKEAVRVPQVEIPQQTLQPQPPVMPPPVPPAPIPQAPVQQQIAQPMPAPVPPAPTQPQPAPPQLAPAPPAPTMAYPMPTAPLPMYTAEQVGHAASPLVEAGRGEELLGMLAQYGVQAVTQLTPEQLADFAIRLRGMGMQI